MKSIILTLLLASLAPAADWRTGLLADATSERVLTGASQNPYSVSPSTRATYATARSYVIRAGDREYTIALRRAARLSLRPPVPRLVVNTAIQFRVEKNRVVFRDDDGKEFLADLEREALSQAVTFDRGMRAAAWA